MNGLEQSLTTAWQRGDLAMPPLTRLLTELEADDATSQIRDSAAGPLAHLLCHASARAVEEDGDLDQDTLLALLGGLSRQRRLLALNDSVDALLNSGPFVGHYGQRLCDALLRGHRATLDSSPMVAAGFLEGALRLAIANAAKPLKVLGALEVDQAADLSPDYAERLPRLIGAALDKWGEEDAVASTLHEGLSSLREIPDAAADATFELGLSLLRQAASAHATAVLELLLQARKQMESAAAADEARDDAALYAAGIDAIFAFTRADRDLLATSREAVSHLLGRRENWLRGLHLPLWRRPRLEAEKAWARLVLILDSAASRLAEPAWLDAWAALAVVLDAYELDRTVSPVPGILDLPGFEAVLRPAIEQRFIRQQSLLATLRYACDAAESKAEPDISATQLQLLRTRVDALVVKPDQHQHRREPRDASEADQQERQRIVANAPSIIAILGEQKAMTLARSLDDDGLRLIEGVAYVNAAQKSAGPAIDGLIHKLTAGLTSCPDYAGMTRQYFDLLLWEAATFLATRHDLQLSGGLAYLKPYAAGTAPHEEKLQNDYADWLRRGQLAGRIQVEVSNVATGRVDIQVGFGTIRFYVEVKRELDNASDTALEKSYLAQAADYSGTNAALGQLLVLDLTNHPDGVRHLSECAWVTTHRPARSAVDRYVVVSVVIGNRDTPRTYSS